MENTGERHILTEVFTDAADYYIHLLHIASYKYALKFLDSEKEVLDFGCGSGYGAYFLSKSAKSVTATDISKEALGFAKQNYFSDNLFFKEISEIEGKKFDLIVSFQVIEHIKEDKQYMLKLMGMLKANGVLLLTTPDKDGRLFKFIQSPWNRFHLKEYSRCDLVRLLSKTCGSYEILKITSNSELLLPELTRRKKLRGYSLPVTLFFYPDSLRCHLLDMQQRFYKFYVSKRRIKKTKLGDKTEEVKDDSFMKYKEDDIQIQHETDSFSDFFVICRN